MPALRPPSSGRAILVSTPSSVPPPYQTSRLSLGTTSSPERHTPETFAGASGNAAAASAASRASRTSMSHGMSPKSNTRPSGHFQDHASTEPLGTGTGAGGASQDLPGAVDGREFFKKARSILSYDEVSLVRSSTSRAHVQGAHRPLTDTYIRWYLVHVLAVECAPV